MFKTLIQSQNHPSYYAQYSDMTDIKSKFQNLRIFISLEIKWISIIFLKYCLKLGSGDTWLENLTSVEEEKSLMFRSKLVTCPNITSDTGPMLHLLQSKFTDLHNSFTKNPDG